MSLVATGSQCRTQRRATGDMSKGVSAAEQIDAEEGFEHPEWERVVRR